MLMKKWIPAIFSESRGLLNWEGALKVISLPPLKRNLSHPINHLQLRKKMEP